MPLTFTDTPLYYKDSQGNYQRILSGADMTGYRTAAAQDELYRAMMEDTLCEIDAANEERIAAIEDALCELDKEEE